MKKYFIICFLMLCGLAATAQDFEIASVEYLENSMQAVNNKVTEQGKNGRDCALLRIATQNLSAKQQESFDFGTDMGSRIEKRAKRDGEIWLWVTPGMRFLIIKGTALGGSRDLSFDDYKINIQSLKTYKIVLRGTLVGDSQYLEFKITPVNAELEVDGKKWPVDHEGTSIKPLDLGTYHYRVTAPRHSPSEGVATLDTPRDTKVVTVNLKPTFVHVTLKVDADAEIWIGKDYKAMRTWTGEMHCGNYTIECRSGDEKSQLPITIKPEMNGKTITLPVPKPYGSLNVISEPDGADIYLDGESMHKQTPASFAEVPVGDHKLRLEKKGCAASEKSIYIKKGRTTEVNEKLDTGKSIRVVTYRAGDEVYVDGVYFMNAPTDVPLGFGQHTIMVRRGEREKEETVVISQTAKSPDVLTFVFDRLISIQTNLIDADITIDGNRVGKSNLEVDLEPGTHEIKAERDGKSAEMTIEVQRIGGKDRYSMVLKGETIKKYVENGVGFFTIDAASSIREFRQPSFGFTIGFVNVVGFYFTAMSNFNFAALKAPYSCTSDGLVYGAYPAYTGKSSNFRLSVMAGLMVDCNTPCSIRVGAGYGMRTRCLEIADGSLVKVEDNCYSTVDLSAGVQFNLKGFTFSVDALSSCFKTIEVKMGIGYCWKLNQD